MQRFHSMILANHQVDSEIWFFVFVFCFIFLAVFVWTIFPPGYWLRLLMQRLDWTVYVSSFDFLRVAWKLSCTCFQILVEVDKNICLYLFVWSTLHLFKVVDAEVGLGAKLHTMILTHRQVDSGIRLFLFLFLALSSWLFFVWTIWSTLHLVKVVDAEVGLGEVACADWRTHPRHLFNNQTLVKLGWLLLVFCADQDSS